MPARSTAEMCTNTSGPPASGWMKPKPFWPLNHFTVPVAIFVVPFRTSVLTPKIGGEIKFSERVGVDAQAEILDFETGGRRAKTRFDLAIMEFSIGFRKKYSGKSKNP